jgi:hypothetical protein
MTASLHIPPGPACRSPTAGCVFRFRAAARRQVEELALREAACCPFLDYRVETADDEVVWTITGDDRDGVAAILDAFYALPAQCDVPSRDRTVARGISAGPDR